MMTDEFRLTMRKDSVADLIRSRILKGAFKPGEKLDQLVLAEELNVSRSPVREALRMLEAEGLITSYPNRGVSVTERTAEELKELYATRSMIEGIAIERALPRLDRSTLDRLDSIIYSASKMTDHEDLLVLNNEFHMTIYHAAPQTFLNQFIQQMRNMSAPYNSLYLDTEGSIQQAWDDHRRIYQACLAGDAHQAKMETCRHLDRVCDALILAMGRA